MRYEHSSKKDWLMGFFDFFSGKTWEELEQKADKIFDTDAYGPGM